MPARHEAALAWLTASRLLPVVVIQDAHRAAGLGTALLTGGLSVAEVTFRTAAATDAIRTMRDAGLTEPNGGLLLGAGTIVTPEQVDSAVAAGARFIVSPGLSRAVVDRCAEHDILVLPGTATATEVQAALAMGLRAVKFFPASTSGGAPAIQAMSGPFPQMRFVPTGGITETNFADYLTLPTVIAAGGSWMVPADAIAAGEFARVEELTAIAVRAAKRARP